MAKTFGVWGIDIGQCALKALRLEMIDGTPTATAFDYIEHAKILSQPDADPDALTREALEKFLSRNPLGRDQVAIGVPGQSGLARFVKLPPVEEKKVADIVKFEAKQQIPFPLEEVVWDYQRLSEKQEVIGGFAMETEIGLFAMKRDIINRYLAHYAGVKAEVHMVQMAPLALANYAAYEVLKKRGDGTQPAEELGELPPGKKKRCVVVLDIGTDGSNLIITDGVKIIWQRPVPLGGNNFTRVLTKEMKLTFAKAEHLKRNAAKSPDLAQILKALRPVLTDFVGEVQRSLGYFTNTHRDAHVAYMIGLGSAFKLPGLQKYLSEKLALEVRKPGKVDGVAGDAVINDPVFTENLLTFPVAYGLALQALALTQPTPDEQKKYALLRTNLLPQEIRVDRLIRAKKPWAAAAAATLLLGSGVVAFGYGGQYKSWKDDQVVKAQAKAESSYKATTAQNGEFTTKDTAAKDEANRVKAIVAGNDERLNWVRIHEVVAAALPRPPYKDDPGNFLHPQAEEKYIRFKVFDPARKVDIDSQAAIDKYFGRVRNGVPPDKMYDFTRSADLPVLNIEAIDCRYTDNLQQFLDNANVFAKTNMGGGLNMVEDLMGDRTVQVPGKDGKTEELKLPAEKEAASTPKVPGPKAEHKFDPKAPEGAAWIVEVRGYTYHRDSFVFIRDSLIYNLQNFHLYALKTDEKGDKVRQFLKDVPDPVLGRVSHAFLAAMDTTKSTQLAKGETPKLKLIDKSYIDQLMSGTGMPGSGEGGPKGAPIGGYSSMMNERSGGGASDGAPTTPTTPWRGLLKGSAAAAGGAFSSPLFSGDASNEGIARRQELTEFVVYFLWREPTPTDDLNK